MPLLTPFSRRGFIAGALAAPAAFASRGAYAAGDVYVRAGANFTPVTIAITPLAGDSADARIGAVKAAGGAPAPAAVPLPGNKGGKKERAAPPAAPAATSRSAARSAT